MLKITGFSGDLGTFAEMGFLEELQPPILANSGSWRRVQEWLTGSEAAPSLGHVGALHVSRATSQPRRWKAEPGSCGMTLGTGSIQHGKPHTWPNHWLSHKGLGKGLPLTSAPSWLLINSRNWTMTVPSKLIGLTKGFFGDWTFHGVARQEIFPRCGWKLEFLLE